MPEGSSHNLMVWSVLPLARILLSGLIARLGNVPCVADECAKFAPREWFPEFNGAVNAATSKDGAIRAKGYTDNIVCMTYKSTKFLPKGKTPEFDGVICTSSGKDLACGVYCYFANNLSMFIQYISQLQFAGIDGSRGRKEIVYWLLLP